jgi:hypothetical protein
MMAEGAKGGQLDFCRTSEVFGREILDNLEHTEYKDRGIGRRVWYVA